jgi:hypothetical protein
VNAQYPDDEHIFTPDDTQPIMSAEDLHQGDADGVEPDDSSSSGDLADEDEAG